MIFVVFVFAGIASPSPDPVTMLLLAVPCVVLVEIAEVIIWLNDRAAGPPAVDVRGPAPTTRRPRWTTTTPVDQHH